MALRDDPNYYIQPLHINGMTGRVMCVPGPKDKKREILVIYGHHSSLERWWGLVQNLHDFGTVYMPDLPGFGGMDSFYTVGKDAKLDNFADYMAAIVRMRYKRKKVVIVGISFGFLVATRMLQRYPELADRVELLISAAGFMRYDDFTFSPRRYQFYLRGAQIASHRPLPFVFRYTALLGPVLRAVYARTNNAKHKFDLAGGDKTLHDKMMDVEVGLWHDNDVRTYMKTTTELLRVDNCHVPIPLTVWHIHTDNDNYFDNAVVEQHMRIVYNRFKPVKIDSKAHVPSVIATKEEAAVLIPEKLKKAFL
ncbi:MAG: alpha/beta hydrolase [Candidatus Saccharimonadales bacterium]